MSVFSQPEVLKFAELSGDYNPLHTDPIAARRLLYGTQVAHGIYGLLTALDKFCLEQGKPITLTSIKASFLKPVKVGLTEFTVNQEIKEESAVITVVSDSDVLQKTTITWEDTNNPGNNLSHTPGKALPQDLSIEQMEGMSGKLELEYDRKLAKELFPNLTLAEHQVSELLATTRLVGMHCPGLHSIYSKLNLKWGDDNQEDSELNWEVTSADDRFNMVTINVANTNINGTITAFVRPMPSQQISYDEAKKLVKADEFLGNECLIVGGSRGIGEVMVKLLAAGGANVKFTYNNGVNDAKRIVQDVKGSISSFQYNIFEESIINYKPTYLYYLPTPFIETNNKPEINEQLLEKYKAYYVTGLQNLLESLAKTNNLPEVVFYPSTVFVEDTPAMLKEYAEAKRQGEQACKELESKYPEVKFYIARMPKVATDQTQTLMGNEGDSTQEVTLKYLRDFKGFKLPD